MTEKILAARLQVYRDVAPVPVVTDRWRWARNLVGYGGIVAICVSVDIIVMALVLR